MRIVAVLAALVTTLAAVLVAMAKVQHLSASHQVRDQAKVAPWAWTASGWIELVSAGGLVVGVFASEGLAVASAIVLAASYLAFALRQLFTRVPAAAVVPAVGLAALATSSAVLVATVG